MKKSLFVVVLVMVFSSLFAVHSHAGWIENGVPFTSRTAYATNAQAISESYYGTIVAFEVCHLGTTQVFARRVTFWGAASWGDEGVNLCTAPGDKKNPRIASDGGGGAIVAWEDYRSGYPHIYAQRVNSNGGIEWGATGLEICQVSQWQSHVQITADGAGGAIIAWEGMESGDYRVFAQRVSASGALQWTALTALGPLCPNEYLSEIISDLSHGAIVCWYIQWNNLAREIGAQRVNASGVVQWGAEGIYVGGSTESLSQPAVCSDRVGGAVLTWMDNRNASESGVDIYAQKIDSTGVAHWGGGVPVCTAAGGQGGAQIAPDGSDGAIVTWCDERSLTNKDIYAQRVNSSGAVQWAGNGVPICTREGDQVSPCIVSDRVSGALVAWVDHYQGWPNSRIYLQRVNTSGAVQWSPDGVAICTAAGDQMNPEIVSDYLWGAVVFWSDDRGENSGVYAGRMGQSGTVEWAPDGVAVCEAAGNEHLPQAVSDGAGGAIVAWRDDRNGIDSDIYAQRINSWGNFLWAADGVAMCSAAGSQSDPWITTDGAGGAIITWSDGRNGVDTDIYAQRVDASGAIQWAVDGLALCTASGSQDHPDIVADGTGGAIIVWEDRRGASDSDIYVQRVDASGAIQWAANGVALCAREGDQLSPRIVSDGSSGAIIAWTDKRSLSESDISVLRVDASGVHQWAPDGVGICTAVGDQTNPEIVSDGAGGAIVAWADMRGMENNDIYAGRVDAAGNLLWAPDGLALCAVEFEQTNPRIASDGAGGAVVVWQDNRGGLADIYAQRVNALGAAQWTAEGIDVCMVGGDQVEPKIISDGAGGAIVTWLDFRGADSDIYAQRLGASGNHLWLNAGVSICKVSGEQRYSEVVSDEGGGAIIVWQDGRSGAERVFAQRVRSSGQIVATLLQSFAADRVDGGVRVDWTVSRIDEGARFTILRASAPAWMYEELEGAPLETAGLSFRFTDGTCLPGSTYKYRVDVEAPGAARKTLFETEAISTPQIPVTLYQNHPNPFNPRTMIRFYLPETREIVLDIYNVAGVRVARLAEGRMERGYHEVAWDGRNSSGSICASGVYFTRLKAGKAQTSRKMLILR